VSPSLDEIRTRIVRATIGVITAHEGNRHATRNIVSSERKDDGPDIVASIAAVRMPTRVAPRSTRGPSWPLAAASVAASGTGVSRAPQANGERAEFAERVAEIQRQSRDVGSQICTLIIFAKLPSSAHERSLMINS